MSRGLKLTSLQEFRHNFEKDAKNQLAQNFCVKHDVFEALRSPKAQTLSHVYNIKVDEAKPVTDQKSSGRCWIFALLNTMRLPVMKQLKIAELEFSQNYLFFWDKVERMHYLLNVYVETARRGEPVDGRLMQHLLHNPSEDGGQWQMLVNLVEKYGIVPKCCFPDAWSSENSRQMGLIINNKMREYCKVLRCKVAEGANQELLDAEILRMTEEVHRIASICIGSPPDLFTWEYYDTDKQYQKIGPITPLDFYRQHVKPHYNIVDKVVVVNDPRPHNPYGHLYTVEFLNNMSGAPLVLYINQPSDVLKRLALEALKANEAVWFGCDVNKHCSWKKFGIEDLKLYEHELLFGVGVHGLNKSDRLLFGESLMTHAMVFTAVQTEGEKTLKWRVENSWSSTGGDNGYLAMMDDWFTEYVMEVVIDKKYLSAEMLDILKEQPRVLPAWDPMGALAGHRCPCTDNTSLSHQ